MEWKDAEDIRIGDEVIVTRTVSEGKCEAGYVGDIWNIFSNMRGGPLFSVKLRKNQKLFSLNKEQIKAPWRGMSDIKRSEVYKELEELRKEVSDE